MGVEFSGAQGKHALAATLEVKPHKGHVGESGLYMTVGVAHLDDQPAVVAQMAARVTQNTPDDIQPIAASAQRKVRLVAELGGHGRRSRAST